MATIFRYFLIGYLKLQAKALLVGGLLCLAMYKLGMSGRDGFILIGWVVAGAPAWIASRSFGGNLSWLRALPLARHELIQVNYVLNMAYSVVGLTAYILFIAVGVALVPDASPSSAATPGLVASSGATPFGPAGVMFVMLSITGWNAMAITVNGVAGTGSVDPVLRVRQARMIAAAMLGVMFLLSLFVEQDLGIYSPWSIATVLLLLSTIFSSFKLSSDMKLPRRQRRICLSAAVVIALSQSFFLYGFAHRGTYSSDPVTVAQAIDFLGPYSRGVSETELAELLAQDLPFELFKDMEATYRDRFVGTKPLDPNRPGPAAFRRMFASKTSSRSVFGAVFMYDLKQVSLSDLRALLAKLQEVDPQPATEPYWVRLMEIRIDAPQLIELLASSNPTENSYALARARYLREPAMVQAIQSRLSSLPESLMPSALLTLSVLSGKRLTMSDVPRLVATTAPLSFDARDCSRVWVANHPESQLEEVNTCIRERGRKLAGMVSWEADQIGWLEPPLTKEQRKLVSRVFKRK